MTASAGYVEAVVEALQQFGPVTVKRMFGGAGIWAEGVMFALIADDVLYLKTGKDTLSRFEAEGLAPFRFAKRNGQVTVTSYWRAPERLIDDQDEMAVWAQQALVAARSTARNRSGRQSRRSKPAAGRKS